MSWTSSSRSRTLSETWIGSAHSPANTPRCAAIGSAIGCPIAQSGEDRVAIAAKLGAFKTSMLQDVEAGKPVELDSLVTVVREIGERVGLATPIIDALLGLARLQARVRGLYP